MNRIAFAVLLFFLVIFLKSCTEKSEYLEPILAKVGSTTLTISEAKSNIPLSTFTKDSTSAYAAFREDWIRQQILIQEAYRLGIHRHKPVQKRINRIKNDYVAQAAQEYILSEIGRSIEVTDAEARSYYQEHKNSFILEERYIRYRHLIAKSLEDANEAKIDLLKGIDWKVVLDNFSINPAFALRESEKFWPESIAASDFGKLNRYLKVIGQSEISNIVNIGSEYHFVQLLEDRAAGDHPDLEWLIDQIKEWLILEKKRKAFNTYVKNLYLQAQANNEIESFDVKN